MVTGCWPGWGLSCHRAAEPRKVPLSWALGTFLSPVRRQGHHAAVPAPRSPTPSPWQPLSPSPRRRGGTCPLRADPAAPGRGGGGMFLRGMWKLGFGFQAEAQETKPLSARKDSPWRKRDSSDTLVVWSGAQVTSPSASFLGKGKLLPPPPHTRPQAWAQVELKPAARLSGVLNLLLSGPKSVSSRCVGLWEPVPPPRGGFIEFYPPALRVNRFTLPHLVFSGRFSLSYNRTCHLGAGASLTGVARLDFPSSSRRGSLGRFNNVRNLSGTSEVEFWAGFRGGWPRNATPGKGCEGRAKPERVHRGGSHPFSLAYFGLFAQGGAAGRCHQICHIFLVGSELLWVTRGQVTFESCCKNSYRPQRPGSSLRALSPGCPRGGASPSPSSAGVWGRWASRRRVRSPGLLSSCL